MTKNSILGSRSISALSAGNNIDAIALDNDSIIATVSNPDFTNPTISGLPIATEDYVDNKWNTLGAWQAPVESRTSIKPETINAGDRFLIIPGSEDPIWAGFPNAILTYGPDGDHTGLLPQDGMVVFAKDTDIIWFYNGTDWVKLSVQVDHNSMIGLQGGTSASGTSSSERYHIDAATSTNLVGLTGPVQTQLDNKAALNQVVRTDLTTSTSQVINGYFSIKNTKGDINLTTPGGLLGITLQSNVGVWARADIRIVEPNGDLEFVTRGTRRLAIDGANGGISIPYLTPNRVLCTDKYLPILTSSAVTPTELGYLSGVTSAIQTQIDNKLNKSNTFIDTSVNTSYALRVNSDEVSHLVPPEGANKISDIIRINQLTPSVTPENTRNADNPPILFLNRRGLSNVSWGQAAAFTLEKARYNVMSSDSALKLQLSSGAANEWNDVIKFRYDGVEFTGLTGDRVTYLDESSMLQASAVTSNELAHLSGVTGAVQTQIDNKLPLAGGTLTGPVLFNAPEGKRLAIYDDTVTGGEFKYVGLGVSSGSFDFNTPNNNAFNWHVGDVGNATRTNVMSLNASGLTIKSGVTNNRAAIIDGAGKLTTSTTTDTELGYLSGTTSSVQTQLNASVRTDLATTSMQTVKGDLTINNANGSIYFHRPGNPNVGVGFESPDKTKLFNLLLHPPSGDLSFQNYNAGVPTRRLTIKDSGAVEVMSLTPNRVVYADGSRLLTSSATTPTELNYLSGTTSAVQTQLNSKLDLIGGTLTGPLKISNRSAKNLIIYDAGFESTPYNYSGIGNSSSSVDYHCRINNSHNWWSGASDGLTATNLMRLNTGGLTVFQPDGTTAAALIKYDNAIFTNVRGTVAFASSSYYGSGMIFRNTETVGAFKRMDIGINANGDTYFRIGGDTHNQPSPLIIRNNRAIELPALASNRALALDANRAIVASATTSTELEYLNGVTSAVQTQLNNRVRTDLATTDSQAINGGLSMKTNAGTFRAGVWPRALIGIQLLNADNTKRFDLAQYSNGDVDIQIGGPAYYQLNTTFMFKNNGDVQIPRLTANRALYIDASKTIKSSATTYTELGYLSGATSNIQAQLNTLAASAGGRKVMATVQYFGGAVTIIRQHPASSITATLANTNFVFECTFGTPFPADNYYMTMSYRISEEKTVVCDGAATNTAARFYLRDMATGVQIPWTAMSVPIVITFVMQSY